MPELVAIAYEEEDAAGRAVEELRRCGEEVPIDPDAAAVLICARDGRCEMTISTEAEVTKGWNEFWGALLESLLGEGPVEIEMYFRKELLARLWPGASMLLLVVPPARKERVLASVSHFEGEAISYRLAEGLPPTPKEPPRR
jgi:uncharacterized membrane protein